MIYNAVLKANRAVLDAAKPGVRWTQMHLLAEKVILSELKVAGLLVGDVEEMVEKRLGAVFMPHGLGHFLGLDVHDVGGFLGDAEPRSSLPGLKSLRTTRCVKMLRPVLTGPRNIPNPFRTLKERMVITIEPGCYFIDSVLDKALADPQLSRYIVAEKLKEYRGTGGVRIEDDVVIWAKGNENMNAELPRTVEEIEAFMVKARAESGAKDGKCDKNGAC